ncbi:MAG: NADH-quinone oxidoreductase subunit NuoN [Propionibacteriaceae bacterium]|jgi:NADH-quinone oxidoreductase subunit N|nr:NADH-quinone oxidoreductase subunit NuoN [Propionibacteriaceae bacterium]
MSQDLLYLAPIISVFAGALLGLLVEALAPRVYRFEAQTCLSGATLVVALIFAIRTFLSSNSRKTAVLGSVTVDGPTLGIWMLLLGFAIGAVVLMAERRAHGQTSAFTAQAATTPGSPDERAFLAARNEHTEVFVLLMFAVGGMLVFPAACDFLTAFVSLEVLSLPLYLLAGLARRNRAISQEAALKYFLLGALSSAIFIYGVALIYGSTGSFDYAQIADSLGQLKTSDKTIYAGLGLVIVGLLFKMGVAPFHVWVPDVYAGSPTAVSAFMAVCTKLAAVGATIRILFVPLGGLRWSWMLPLACIAVLSMLVGAIFGLTQRNLKRLLGYSSIAHAGFILMAIAMATTGVVGTQVGEFGSVGVSLFYMLAYGLATLGAFAITLLVRSSGGTEASEIYVWTGFGRRNPWYGIAMVVFMLSLAGMPLTAGFIAKLYVFALAWFNGYAWLAIAGLTLSLLTAAMYLKVIRLLFLSGGAAPSGSDNDQPTPTTSQASKPLNALIALCVMGTVFFGLLPSQFGNIAAAASVLLR